MIIMLGSRTLIAVMIGASLLVPPTARAGTAYAMPHTAGPDRSRSSNALSLGGYGGIRIGSRPETLRRYTLTNKRSSREECYVTGIKEVPGMALLVISGTIKRISIGENGTSPIRTDRDIGIGSTETMVRKAYRKLRITPHRYVDAPASYLTSLGADGKEGVRFETGRDRRVKVIHAGAMPELEYVERCG